MTDVPVDPGPANGPSDEMVEAATDYYATHSTEESCDTLAMRGALAAVWPLVQARYTTLETENERLERNMGRLRRERNDEIALAKRFITKRDAALARVAALEAELDAATANFRAAVDDYTRAVSSRAAIQAELLSMTRYAEALARGLSDAEARAEGWPVSSLGDMANGSDE